MWCGMGLTRFLPLTTHKATAISDLQKRLRGTAAMDIDTAVRSPADARSFSQCSPGTVDTPLRFSHFCRCGHVGSPPDAAWTARSRQIRSAACIGPGLALPLLAFHSPMRCPATDVVRWYARGRAVPPRLISEP